MTVEINDTLEWATDCEFHHGRILSGEHAHYCADWDWMPIDETCPEFEACLCYPNEG